MTSRRTTSFYIQRVRAHLVRSLYPHCAPPGHLWGHSVLVLIGAVMQVLPGTFVPTQRATAPQDASTHDPVYAAQGTTRYTKQ